MTTLRVPTTWGAIPDHCTVIDANGATVHVDRRLPDPGTGLVWHRRHAPMEPPRTLVHAPGEACWLVLADTADAVVNILHVFPRTVALPDKEASP
jgi:hypothetical protein